MNNKLKRHIAIGVMLIFIGITFILNDYINTKREEVFSTMNLALSDFDIEEETEEIEEPTPTPTEEPQEETEEIDYETYVGILEIPKIGFYKGFYVKESPLNDVKTNIKILEVSAYPNEDNGNVIIIGHSGNYTNSYFANLYQLTKGDTASITYKNIKYTYMIDNIYTEPKDGNLTIYRDKTKNTLTLITCTKDDETTQTIYIMYLTATE